jgi:hypothetical protein
VTLSSTTEAEQMNKSCVEEQFALNFYWCIDKSAEPFALIMLFQ